MSHEGLVLLIWFYVIVTIVVFALRLFDWKNTDSWTTCLGDGVLWGVWLLFFTIIGIVAAIKRMWKYFWKELET